MALAIIGGSGVYKLEGLEIIREHAINTPFGQPSGPIIECELNKQTVFFLPRHGQNHHLIPSEVPYRANIHALKSMGVTKVLAISAVGIMDEAIKPGDIVIPDQIFDRTKGIRANTFFGDGVAGHVPFADPFCNSFNISIENAAKETASKVHMGGTYVCMEGPAFSTRSESKFYRETLRPSVIGMTAIPEAKLAREAELCYGMLATATDYDCWHEGEEDVSVEAVIAVLNANKKTAERITSALISTYTKNIRPCGCANAAQFAMVTSIDSITNDAKQRLKELYGKYW